MLYLLTDCLKYKLMKNRIIVLLCLFPIALQAQNPGFAEIKEPKAIMSKISENARTIFAIESDFVQEKNISVLSEKIVSKGHLIYKKENKLRWEYKSPFNYLVILNNGKIFIKDDNKENKFDMQSNKMFQEINALIVNSVQGNISESKNYKVKLYQGEEFYLVDMIPLSGAAKEFFSSIQIYFKKSDLNVSKINMVEIAGDYTLISFAGSVYNREIADEKFSFR